MDEKTVLEKYTEQGCGECPKNKIGCKECKEGICNSEDFIKNMNLCWDNKGIKFIVHLFKIPPSRREAITAQSHNLVENVWLLTILVPISLDRYVIV